MTNKADEYDMDLEKLRKAIQETFRIPKQAYTCDECGGRIVKQATSLFRRQYYFSKPECEKYGTTYWGTDQAYEVGVEEFEKMMHEPFTI